MNEDGIDHNHRSDISKTEAKKAMQALKSTAKCTELSTRAVLGAVSLQVTIIINIYILF